VALLAGLIRGILLLISLRGVRWAYLAFILLSLAYFPLQVGFHLDPHACQLTFSPRLAAFSLTNYPHIILFAIFFVVSSAQTGPQPSDRTVLAFCALATLTMGALVEIGEGVSGHGNCRLRDLIPDSVGILLGASALIVWRTIRHAPTLNPFAPWNVRKHRVIARSQLE
jgi:hypothetical protein